MIFWLASLLVLQVGRLIFLIRSSAYFDGLSFIELSKAFVYGLRFDMASLAYLYIFVLGIDIILKLLKSKYSSGIARLLKVLGVSAFFLISLIDAEYFVIAHKRLDTSILLIGGDIADQSRQLILHYKYVVVSFILSLFVFWHLSGRRVAHHSDRNPSSLKGFFKAIAMLPLAILLARGGFQEKPIKISSATALGSARLVNLGLSTPFVLIHTLRSDDKLRVYSDFDKSQAKKIIQDFTRSNSERSAFLLTPRPQDNVVILILESFSNEYAAFTPFLEGLKRKSISFENHFANGNTSIEAIPSILGGLVSFLNVPFITSPYVGSEFKSLPHTDLKKTHDFIFMHGARKGSMYFDSFTRYLGFEHYFAKEDYVGDPKAFYDWGVHDHAFLDFSGKTLGSRRRPFVASIFTLSSHQPYEIPAEFSTSLAQAPTPFTRSLRYADYSLQLFFEKYSKQDWFKKTLFVITGDHTSHCQSKEYCSPLASRRVPLLLYHGGINLGEHKLTKNSQHVDIPATVADYLSFDTQQLLPFGKSLLRDNTESYALLNTPHDYSMLYKNSLFRLDVDSLTRCELGAVAEQDCVNVSQAQYPLETKYLKALRSYFTQSLDQRSFE